MTGICTDVTEQTIAEQILREAEEKYRALFENAAFGVFQTTPDGRFITANEALAGILGFPSSSQMIAQVTDIGREIHSDPARREEFASRLRAGEVVTGFESLARRHDNGDPVWISLTARARRDGDGEIINFEGIVEDITERKRSDQRLAVQYAVTRLLAGAPSVEDAMPKIICAICDELDWMLGAIWVVDRESDVLRCLDVAAKAGVEASPFDEITRSLTFEKGVGLPGRVWESGEPAWIDDVREDQNFPRAEAARKTGLCSAFAFPIELDGETIGVMEFFTRDQRDQDPQLLQAMRALGVQVGQFVERKRAEDERDNLLLRLQSAESRYRTLFSDVGDAILVADEQGRYTDANSAAVMLLGYTRDELLTMSVADVTALEPAVEYERFVDDGAWAGEIELRRKDGVSVLVEARASVIETPNGRMFASVLRDVSERKRAERELQKLVIQLELARQRVDNLVSNVPGVVWEAWGQPDEANQRIDFVSAYVEEMLGYSVEHWLSTPNFWLSIVHPEDRERAAAEAAAIYASGTAGRSEFRWIAADRRVFWVEAQSTVIRDHEGNPVGMRGVTMDISQRRLAEAQLRETEERFSKAFHASPAGLSIVSSDDRRFLDVNDAFLEITGFQRDEIIGRLVDELGLWPDNGGRLAMQEALTAGGGHARNLELKIQTKAGELRSVLGSAEVIGLGGKQAVLSLIYDITERKEAETLLHEANVRLSQETAALEKSAERQAILAEASSILASSLDYTLTLGEVARLLVQRTADICSVDLVDDGTVRRVALAHFDPAVQQSFDRMPPEYTPNSPEHVVLRVTRSGSPELRGGLDDEELRNSARDSQHLQMLRDLGVRSAAVVPLTAAGRTLGTLTLALVREGREYTQDDLELTTELARRAGLAIDNAMRYAGEENARREAEAAAERTARLQAVTATLSESLTAVEVGRVVIEAAMAIVRARSGIIALIAPGDRALELVASEGVQSAFVETWDAFATNPPPELVQALKTAEPLFIESRDELLSMFPMLQKLSVVAGRSFGSAPLKVENRVIGCMVLTFDGPAPGNEDREFIVALARLSAQALERARLYEAEQEARRKAEDANLIVSRLQAVTEAALTHLSLDDLLKELLDRIEEMLDVQTVAVLLLEPDGQSLELRAVTGRPTGSHARFRVAIGDGFAGTIAATRQPLLVNDAAQITGLSEEVRSRAKSLLGVPMIVEGRVTGVLHVGSSEGRPFTEDDARLLQLVADRAALAIDHIELYEAEQQARAEAEMAERKQSFLAEASAMLASSLDYETTLASLAELCVPYLGDWCAIDVLSGDCLERVAVVHTDTEKVEFARGLVERYPLDASAPDLRIMLNEGRSLFHPRMTEALLAAVAHDEEHLEILRGMGVKSAMTIPLKARGRTLGVLSLAMAESGRTYTRSDLSLAEDLAHRAALAVDNARLYSESQRVQEELRLANEAKDEFLGLVSHELRTPITTIYGGARLMRSRGDNLDPDSRRGVLDDIEHESERLHRIVEDLLVLARVELGQEVITEPVLVQRVAERTVAALSRRKAGRQIDLEMSADLPPVRASSVYLEQILRNLVNNADKYSPSEEAIELRAHLEGDEVFVSVLDRGPGIPADELELIFERFYRSSGTAKQAGGAGIGLTVCKRLLEAQSGRIWAEARDGGGLVISFSLPVYEEPDD
jgi:PAS domain S-box-containing protein